MPWSLLSISPIQGTWRPRWHLGYFWKEIPFGILGGVAGGAGGFFLEGSTDATIFIEQGVVEITVFALTGLFGGAAMMGRAGGRNSNIAQSQEDKHLLKWTCGQSSQLSLE
jgi:hypothetical protein